MEKGSQLCYLLFRRKSILKKVEGGSRSWDPEGGSRSWDPEREQLLATDPLNQPRVTWPPSSTSRQSPSSSSTSRPSPYPSRPSPLPSRAQLSPRPSLSPGASRGSSPCGSRTPSVIRPDNSSYNSSAAKPSQAVNTPLTVEPADRPSEAGAGGTTSLPTPPPDKTQPAENVTSSGNLTLFTSCIHLEVNLP